MDDSIDNTNDLENYGVWVKHSAKDENDLTDSLDSLDLPDFPDMDTFDDTDFSDMFKDDSQFTSEKKIEDFDTQKIETPEIEIPTDISEQSLEASDFADFTDNFETNDDEVSVDSFATEQPAETEVVSFDSFEEVSFDSDGEEEISLDDFMDEGFSDVSVAAGNNGFEPGKNPAEMNNQGSEEVSLDDFFGEDGFDFGMEAPKKEEEIFMEEKPLEMEIDFDDSVDSVETEDNTEVDTDSLDDMDDEYEISQSLSEDLTEPVITDSSVNKAQFGDTEEIDLSDFGIDAEAEETPVTQDVEEAKNKEKVIDYDLSVGNENMTSAPIVNEIKTDNNDVADASELLDLSEENENMATVDSSLLQQIIDDLSGLRNEINQLKSNLASLKSTETVTTPVAEPQDMNIDIPAEDENTGFFASDDEDDTIALSGNELDNILNTAEFSEADGETVIEESFEIADEPIAEDPVIEESFDIVDETVAEEPVVEESFEIADESVTEEPVLEDSFEIADESVAEEPVVEESFDISDEPIAEEPVIEESFEIADETIAEESVVEDSFDIADETVTEEPVIEESFDIADESITEEPVVEESFEIADETVTEEPVIEESFDIADEPIAEEPVVEDSFDIADEPIAEEPVIEESFDIADETIAEDNTIVEETFDDSLNLSEEDFTDFEEESELPDEISIPKDEDDGIITVDDVISEPITDGFMEETAVAESEVFDEPFNIEDTINTFQEDISSTEDNSFDIFENEITDEFGTIVTTTENEEEIEQDVEESFNTVESFGDMDSFGTVGPEETVEEKSISDDILSEEIEDSFDTVDTFDAETSVENVIENDIVTTNDQIDFEEQIVDSSDEIVDNSVENLKTETKTEINSDLKSDIKSVLLYMDQLLENLPEEKIMEFAHSDEFATYKKLFNELGLS